MKLNKNETPVSLREAASLVPTGNGRRLNYSTIHRWARKGVCGIKLEHVRYGRAMFTSKEALERFAARVADARAESMSNTEEAHSNSATVRDERVAVAEARCEEYGV